jgi:hypothetical protein
MAILRSRGDAPAANAKSDSLPWLRYAATEGSYAFVPAGSPGELGIPVHLGTLVILDFRRVREGEVSFTPKFDDKLMVPRGQPLPPRCGKKEYADGLQIDLVVQKFGLATLTSTADCVCKMLERLYDTYSFAPEAQEGKLLICRLDPSRSFKTQHGSTLYDPKWTIVGWAPRSGHFRPALIAIPKPIAFESQAVIESDVAFNDGTLSGAVEEPVSESAGTEPADTEPAETEPAETEPTEIEPASKPASGNHKGRKAAAVPLPRDSFSGPDPDLNDVIPF